jgi:hypothetical protein
VTGRRRSPENGGNIMIVKEKEGYRVKSEKGKNLGGPYKTKAEAKKRLLQVEYFKHKKPTKH